MKFLALILLVAAGAQASLVSTITASTGVPQPATVCRDTYTAPPESPSFDRSCFAPNPVVPARFAYAEVSAQGPMHLFLETIGGVTAVGCTPLDGCPDGFAQLSYNDVWTITGGTGAGTHGLFFTSSGARDFRLSDISVQGKLELGTNSF